MAKKASTKGKLTRVTKPEATSEDVVLVNWKPNMADAVLQGHITEVNKFKNKFGNETCLANMTLEKVSLPKNVKAEKLGIDELPCDIKFFCPRMLEKLLEQVDTDGLVVITYNGKNEEGHHDFDLDAEIVNE